MLELQILRPHEHEQAHMHLAGVLDELGLGPAQSFLVCLEIAATTLSMAFGGSEESVREMARRFTNDLVTIFNNTAPLRETVRQASELGLSADETMDRLKLQAITEVEKHTGKRASPPPFICPPSKESH